MSQYTVHDNDDIYDLLSEINKKIEDLKDKIFVSNINMNNISDKIDKLENDINFISTMSSISSATRTSIGPGNNGTTRL